MSLSGALYNAFSGLKANARAAALVSTNIANATTESYGRRSLALSPGAAGTHGGVRVDAVTRHTDPILLADRRLSDAEVGHGGTMLAFAERIEMQIGGIGTNGSLSDRLTAFENALTTAASNPASQQRLETVASTAVALATTLNTLSTGLQDARETADRAIAGDVSALNDTLRRLDKLNDAMVKASSTRGADVSALLDERQRLIDGLSQIVPLRVVERDRGEIALFTMGGAVLLDGRPAEIGFTPTASIDAGMSLSGGPLSGLTLDGRSIPSTENGMFRGGRLAANFAVRDDAAPRWQAQIDGLARDLVERLGPGGPDATLGATDPGLFTDGGAAFDPLNESGLAGRIALNALVAPGSGGSWRLRDGLGAATQGEAGEARLLIGVSAALGILAPPSSSALPPVARGFADRLSEFASGITSARVRTESEQTYLATQNLGLKELELARGVDTDAELQRLMQIEQHYAANAQVMSAVDDMMQQLMRI